MKRILFIIALFLLVTSAQATPPPPLGSTLEPGVVGIGWANDVQADTVVAILDRDDCRGPAFAAVDPLQQQAHVQVPAGPPYDARCLLRPGDHVWLALFRAGRYVDQLGPYVVPIKVWFPMIGG